MVGRLAVALCALALAMPALAHAHDTEAPPHAPMNWLPYENWVVRHWIPFEEPDLYSALGVSRRELWRWLDDHEHTIAGLARRRGVDPDMLVDRLMASWRGPHDDVRRRHVARALTQSHLSRHLLFHLFHNRRIGWHARSIVGVSRARWAHMRRRGYTVLEIAERGGRSEPEVRRGIWRLLVHEQRVGVARGMTSPAQARRLLSRQHRELKAWIRRNRLAPKQAT